MVVSVTVFMVEVFMALVFMEDIIAFTILFDGGILILFILPMVLGFTTLTTTEDIIATTGFSTIDLIAMPTDTNPKEDHIQIRGEEQVLPDLPQYPQETLQLLREKEELLDQ